MFGAGQVVGLVYINEVFFSIESHIVSDMAAVQGDLWELYPDLADGGNAGHGGGAAVNEAAEPRYTMEELMVLYGGVGTPCRFHLMWRDIQEMVGPASAWPAGIRRFMWTRNLRNWPRTRLASFMYINGLPREMVLHWGIMLQLWTGPGDPSFRHMKRLMGYMEAGVKYRLWGWNVARGRCEWLDGTPRLY